MWTNKWKTEGDLNEMSDCYKPKTTCTMEIFHMEWVASVCQGFKNVLAWCWGRWRVWGARLSAHPWRYPSRDIITVIISEERTLAYSSFLPYFFPAHPHVSLSSFSVPLNCIIRCPGTATFAETSIKTKLIYISLSVQFKGNI